MSKTVVRKIKEIVKTRDLEYIGDELKKLSIAPSRVESEIKSLANKFALSDYESGICFSEIYKLYQAYLSQDKWDWLFNNHPDNCIPESELEEAQNAKTLEKVTALLNKISEKAVDAEAVAQKAEAELTTSQQRGTYNSCWGGYSPELSHACVQRYQRIFQARVRVKNKYKELQNKLEEQSQSLQEEELLQNMRNKYEELQKQHEEELLQNMRNKYEELQKQREEELLQNMRNKYEELQKQREEELIQNLKEKTKLELEKEELLQNIDIEIEIDVSGDVTDTIETGYEQSF